MSTAWTTLIVAGLLEIAWTLGLKASDGFTRPVPSILTLLALAASMWLLASAVRTLPIGTAYAVWVGIGTVGAAVLGIALHGEPLTLARVGFLTLLVVSLVGLKATSGG